MLKVAVRQRCDLLLTLIYKIEKILKDVRKKKNVEIKVGRVPVKMLHFVDNIAAMTEKTKKI